MNAIFYSLLNLLCALFIGASLTMGAVIIIMVMAFGTLKLFNFFCVKINKLWGNDNV